MHDFNAAAPMPRHATLSEPWMGGGRAWLMSIPSIHAEKVADIRFRNEREREGGKEGRKEGRKDSSFAFLSHSLLPPLYRDWLKGEP